MKKIATKSGRKIFSLILAFMLMLGVSSNVFAGWEAYNNGIPSSGVYLQETWIGEKQSINFWENGQWIRNVAGESHTLWINSQPILYDLYDTRHWCYDQYGNCFAINTNQRLLFCGRGSTTFSINNDITGCTGFQRDGNKIGYWVNTYNGSYSLSDLLNGGNSTINNNTSYDDLVREYPYVKNQDNMFYYYASSSQYYTYCLYDSNLVYKGSNTNNNNVLISDDVEDVNFTNGYIVYALNSGDVYKMRIGSTYKSSVQYVGRNYYYFREVYPCWSYCYYNTNCNEITYETEDDDNYNYDDNTYDFPYVKKSGDCNYYYYTSNSKYYQYYLRDSVLYYEGTNNSKSHTKISNSVNKIVFSKDGYIVYSDHNGNVYSYPLGNTSYSYRKEIGTRFSYFDQYNYMSGGYYNTSGRYVDFNSYNNNDDYNSNYPYVKKSGNNYYYYSSNSTHYRYYLSGSSLYYYGMNNISDNRRITTSVSDITFSKDGYVVYSTYSGEVYAYPLGEVSSSYRKKIGTECSYFEKYNYMSEGYYNKYDEYITFDHYDYDDNNNYNYPYVKRSGSYYYYYTSRSKYYKYYLDSSTLYYEGTNNNNYVNTRIDTSVDEITFSKDGYIIYSKNNGYVYAYSLGRTTSSYKIQIGREFSYFNQYNYMSDGYYDEYDDYVEFDF